MAPGDWAKGERGLACLPGRVQEFRESTRQALDYADALGCDLIHCMAGIVPAGVSRDTAASLYAANVAWAAELAHPAGVKLVLEPINHRDMPGFFLNTQAQGAAIVEALGRDRVGLQFDIYHCQVTEGDITKRMEAHMPVIAHMQIADVPARNEPGTGEINWEYVFRRIDELGFKGWVGCEYRPAERDGCGARLAQALRRLRRSRTCGSDLSGSASWAGPWRSTSSRPATRSSCPSARA